MESLVGRQYGSPLFFRNRAHPIEVPRHEKLDEADENELSKTYRGSSGAFTPLSPIGFASRTRKSSISFDPKAKLEDGGACYLHQGPPKDKGRVRTEMESPGASESPLSFKKVPVKINQGNSGGSGLGLRTDTGYEINNSRPSISQVYRQTEDISPIDRLSSLTSASTISPPNDEVRTPPQPGGFNSDWFPQAAALSVPDGSITRNRSERSFRRRRPRRTFTDRSTHSVESATSAASLYLSSWGGTPISPVQSEGEEIGDYVIGKPLGHGGFSIIKEASTIKDGITAKCAVKIVERNISEHENTEADKIYAVFEHEIDVWRCVKHQHILPLIEVYHTVGATYCFMEYMSGGSLLGLINQCNKSGGFPATLARKLAYQLASALRYLHEDARIIHRDVKVDNCLLKPVPGSDGDYDLKLGDFGLSQYIIGSVEEDNQNVPYDSRNGVGRTGSPPNTTTFTGSLPYAAPELLNTTEPLVSPAIDVWAFGILVYTMFTGRLPFSSDFNAHLQAMIIDGTFDITRFKESAPYLENKALGSAALAIVLGCMTKDVEERWTIRQVLESDWLRALAEDGQDI